MTTRSANDLLRDSLLEVQRLRSALHKAETVSREPVAVVAMACRTPGDAITPEIYWELLADGRDAIASFPSRWEVDALYDPDPEALGKTYARTGGFLSGLDRFDPAFFGISPREASGMAPQQRLVLEVCWEALERAGVTPASLEGSRTGVYIGSMGSDYGHQEGVLLDGHRTGQANAVLSGRVSYVLGLQGPAMTIDTACSSSLVALHLACAGLRQGECDLALAGGVQIMNTPAMFVEFSRLRGLAPDGRCKSFSASADGAGWAEGCGVMLLKRLSEALRDGDRIVAVIRGSAVNQDGRSQGLTAPNGPSQQRVIRQALLGCGLAPSDIDAVEAHGTGTPLGDPIEAGALAAVFGKGRDADRPLWLGSSKSNLGHAQAAAGVLGVMKMVLALKNELLPQTLHAEQASPHIDWQTSGLSLLQNARSWPRQAARTRRAGISSFGLSGTNAHLILEEAPLSAPRPAQAQSAAAQPFVLSGRTPRALAENAARLAAYLGAHPAVRLGDVAYSLAVTRTVFEHRAAFGLPSASEAGDHGDLRAALLAYSTSGELPAHGHERQAGVGKTCMLFTGQGSQRLAMGRGLYGAVGFEVFTSALEACFSAFDAELGVSLRSVMWDGDGGDVNATRYTQPALFCLEVALYRQWSHWGVAGDVLLGHSVGELCAAHVAEVFSLSDAARLVCARGRLMEELAQSGGAMASLGASEAEVLSALACLPEELRAGVELAGLNGPAQTVVSGDEASVAVLCASMERSGVRTKRLTVSHAFHSRHLDGMLSSFGVEASKVRYQAPRLSVISNLTGRLADVSAGELVTPAYWVQHVRAAVRFVDGVKQALELGVCTFVECGPQGVLCGLVASVAEARSTDAAAPTVLASLRAKLDDQTSMVSALGGAHTAGAAVNWQHWFAGQDCRRIDLPTYAFQRERYWLESTPSRGDVRGAGLTSSAHPLLGAAISLADSEGFLFTGRLSLSDQRWLRDHAVHGTVLMPGTGLLELALEAGAAVSCNMVEELTLSAPLLLSESCGVRLQVRVGAPEEDGGGRHVAIYSRPDEGSEDGAWTPHASGTLRASSLEGTADERLCSWPPADARELDLSGLYATLATQGYAYGPSFHGLTRAWVRDDEVYGLAKLPAELTQSAPGYGMHPALLDSALHALMASGAVHAEEVLLPFSWSEVQLHASGASELRVRLSLRNDRSGEGTVQLSVADSAGRPVLSVGALHVRRASAEQMRAASRASRSELYAMSWQQVALTETTSSMRDSMFVGFGSELSAALGGMQVTDVLALEQALDAGHGAPSRLVLDLRSQSLVALGDNQAERVLSFSVALIRDLQFLLSDQRLLNTEFVWLTGGAVALGSEPVLDPVQSPAWGLLRCALSEHPTRALRLLDVCADGFCPESMKSALCDSDEPELVLRQTKAWAPRLVAASPAAGCVFDVDVAGCVLVTGSQEVALGVCTQLVGEHGVRHLVLALDEEVEPEGLVSSLQSMGALTVRVSGVDSTNESELRELLSSVKAERALTGVFHAGGGHDVQEERVDEWCYEERWARVSGLPLLGEVGEDCWLVRGGASTHGWSETLRISLETSGVQVELSDYCESELSGRTSWPSTLVLLADGSCSTSWLTACQQGLSLMQALRASGSAGAATRLWFVTLGSQHVEDSCRSYSASLQTLWGLGRSMSMEVPEQFGGLLDLPSEPETSAGLSWLVGALMQGRAPLCGDELALRCGAVWTRKLVRSRPSAGASGVEYRARGTALITGGTGALGGHLAHWLVERGVSRLVLTSRRGASSPGAEELLRSLRAKGCAVEAVSCAMEDDAAVESLVGRLALEGLQHVYHVAGVGVERSLSGLSGAELAAQMLGKVGGAWSLQRSLERHDVKLESFVMYGSIAGLWGSANQCAYSAANAGLAGVMQYRRERGEAATLMHWGPWAEGGMVSAELSHQLSRVGLSAMSPGLAERALGRALSAGTSALAVVDVDWARFGATLSTVRARPLLSEVCAGRHGVDDVQGMSGLRLARRTKRSLTTAHLLEALTRQEPLSSFVLCTRGAGLLGSAGSAADALEHGFMQGLASQRQLVGLPAVSVALSLPEGATSEALRKTSLSRVLSLLGAARVQRVPELLAGKLNLTAVQRGLAAGELVPGLLRGLVRPGLRRATAAASAAHGLRDTLTPLSEAERKQAVLSLVQEEVAKVLGLAAPQAVAPEQALSDSGLDSVMAVSLKNQLAKRAGVVLPSTLAFDYPTPKAIAGLIESLLELGGAQRAQRKLAAPKRVLDHAEPIAVVAMGCRTPGGAVTPEQYWDLFQNERDLVGPFPERWDTDALYDPNPDAVGKTYTRTGGFLDQLERFDPAFFGISPREAAGMDPQQRLVLEVAWETLERAGITPAHLEGSRTGVYLGSMGSDYGQGENTILELCDGYRTGQAASVLSGRISYVLGLQGPALTVDTACSSSLVALHLACAGLRQGECDLALAGGVQIMNTPAMFVDFSRLRVLAPDGRCKSFSALADGAGWSEGCGMLLLKRLSDAERDGDRIVAVVRGSAVNQDGRSQGLTAPNGPSQQRVLRQALEASGLVARDIDAVEAHGTGTPLGDPIEAGALAAVLGAGRRGDQPLWLGSSKSNLGHTQAAAGVLGVMKMALALKNERLPKTLHAEQASPHIDWETSGLSLLQQARAWPREQGRKRRAGISSFGISGTNAHMVLEEAPVRLGPSVVAEAASVQPLVVSGRTAAALAQNAARLSAYLGAHPDVSSSDLAYSLATTRTAFDERASFCVSSAETEAGYAGLRAALEAFSASAEVPAGAHARRVGVGKTCMLFTGQGSQRLAMGRGLYGAVGFEVFTSALEACFSAFDAELGVSLRSVMWDGDGGDVNATRYTQPALFCLEVALYRQWSHWGVAGDVLLGHSVGELCAAHVAEVFSLSDAARLVCARGRLMEELAQSGGAMASLGASEAEVLSALACLPEELRAGVELAGLNGPAQTVVSGDEASVAALCASMERSGVRTKRLTVSHAFHSRHLDGMLSSFGVEASKVRYQAPRLSVISNLTGRLADVSAGELVTPAYWVQHVRAAVRFVDGVKQALELGVCTFVECGPQGVLCGLVASVAEARSTDAAAPTVLASLRAKLDDQTSMVSALGGAHTAGAAVNWQHWFAGQDCRRIDLPTYAFQRERYWLESTPSRGDVRGAGLTSSAHPLLGAAISLADSEGFLFTGRLSLSDQRWLRDHAVHGTVLMPGTGLLELALEAGAAVSCNMVEELTLSAPLLLSESCGARLQVRVGAPEEDGARRLTIHSCRDEDAADGVWTLHASGTLRAVETAQPQADESLRTWPPANTRELDLASLYPKLAQQGYDYGPSFQGLTRAWLCGDQVYGSVKLPAEVQTTARDYGLHPALLDAAMHTLMAAAMGPDEVLLPFSWSKVQLHAAGASELRVRLSLRCETAGEGTVQLSIADAAGAPVLSVGALEIRRASAEQLRAASDASQRELYAVRWQRVELAAATPRSAQLVGAASSLSACFEGPGFANVHALQEALDAGQEAPRQLVIDLRRRVDERPTESERALTYASEALHDAATLLSDARLSEVEFVWLVAGALQVVREGVLDLAQAAACGSLRSARNEHPERALRLLDAGQEEDAQSIFLALQQQEEPELALRGGSLWAPRLVPADTASPAAGCVFEVDVAGCVLVTGSQEVALGVCTQLVGEHGVRHLVLALDEEVEPEGLVSSLQSMGALTVRVSGVDSTNESELRELLSSVKAERALTGVFHAGGGHDAQEERVDEWCYEERWARVSGLPLLGEVGEDCWLVRGGASTHGWSETLRISLETSGVQVELSDYCESELAGRTSWPSTLVLLADGSCSTSWLTACQQGLSLMQALRASGSAGAATRLWFVTLGSQHVEDSCRSYSASLQTLWGLGRSMSMEVPEQFGGLLDLPSEPETSAGLSWLVGALMQGRAPLCGDELALRCGAVWTRKLVRSRPSAGASGVEYRARGTALITGGTGALGGHLAHWLVERGVSRLVLTSRRGASSPGAEELLRSLRAKGCAVEAVSCAMEDDAAVESLVGRLALEGLQHVYHVAGVGVERSLSGLSGAELAAQMLGKVGGAWSLQRSLERHDVKLDSFVMYGSIAGLWGSANQCAYSAANAGLAGVMQYRRERGEAATLMHWGPWAEGGMVSAELSHQLSRVGLSAMSPGLAERALGRALSAGTSALAVVDVDWARFGATLSTVRARPLLSEVCAGRHGVDDVQGMSGLRLARRTKRSLTTAHLLEALTRQEPLSSFVLCTRGAGLLGSAGSAADALEHGFMQGLASQRQLVGLPAVSVALSLPEGATSEALRKTSLSQVLSLLGAARVQRVPELLAGKLNLTAVQRGLAAGELVPGLLRGLVRPGLRRATAAASAAHGLRDTLTPLSEAERKQAVLSLVQEEVAKVLGLAAPQAVAPEQALSDSGLDSVMAVELRNRLAKRAGVGLPSTLAFDYPTPKAIAGLIVEELGLESAPDWTDDEIRKSVSLASIETLRATGLLSQLMKRLSEVSLSLQLSNDGLAAPMDGLSEDSLLDLVESTLRGNA